MAPRGDLEAGRTELTQSTLAADMEVARLTKALTAAQAEIDRLRHAYRIHPPAFRTFLVAIQWRHLPVRSG